jgi:hypothetical protein
MREVLVVQMRQAPGDTLALTAAVRDLALTHPDRFDLRVATNAADLWRHNPHVRWAGAYGQGFIPGTRVVTPQYGKGLRAAGAGERVHFVDWLRRDLAAQLGLTIAAHLPHPDLHLAPEERRRPVGLPARYWVVAAGGKADMPAKMWPTAHFQSLIDRLAAQGLPCVRLGASRGRNPMDLQPRLDGVVDLLDRTNLRQALAVIHAADGVLCHNSFPMHAAAALGRPAVVLAGGRESPYWAAYERSNPGLVCPELLPVPHRFLHTVDTLACAGVGGCGKTHLRPEPGKSLCSETRATEDGPRALCQTLITPDDALAAVRSYYDDGTLPPRDQPASWVDPGAGLDLGLVAPAPETAVPRIAVRLFPGAEPLLPRLREVLPPDVEVGSVDVARGEVDYVLRIGPGVEIRDRSWWPALATLLVDRPGLVGPMTGPDGPSPRFHVASVAVLDRAGAAPTVADLAAACADLGLAVMPFSTYGGLVRT